MVRFLMLFFAFLIPARFWKTTDPNDILTDDQALKLVDLVFDPGRERVCDAHFDCLLFSLNQIGAHLAEKLLDFFILLVCFIEVVELAGVHFKLA